MQNGILILKRLRVTLICSHIQEFQLWILFKQPFHVCFHCQEFLKFSILSSFFEGQMELLWFLLRLYSGVSPICFNCIFNFICGIIRHIFYFWNLCHQLVTEFLTSKRARNLRYWEGHFEYLAITGNNSSTAKKGSPMVSYCQSLAFECPYLSCNNHCDW